MTNRLTFLFLFLLIPFGLTAEDDDSFIAVFKIDDVMSEGYHTPGIQELLANDPDPKTFMSLITRIRQASKDKRVKACVFYGDNSALGMAQNRELQKHIRALKKAGIKTYFYSRNISPANIFTAAETDKVVLFPQGEVLFNGMFIQNMYYKNLLDKIGLEADIIHIGDFKSAGEPFYLTGPSKDSQKQTETLMNDIALRLVESISQSRKISEDKVRGLVDKAFFSAKEAQQAGLVDELLYHKDFIASLKREFGDKTRIINNYAKPKKQTIQLNSILDIFALINKLSTPPKKDDMDKISLTVLEGAIDSEMGENLRKHILKMAKDKTVKAMVLRVNSPGGSAQASEIIHRSLTEFKKSGKPLIVTMGNVAASGGYYVAAPGDFIFAEDLTITGSIGVVGGKIALGGLMDKIGITTHEFKKGKHADLMNPMRKFNEEEKKILMQAFNRVYTTFKQRVTEGRGSKIKGDLESLAGGRVYTGAQALKIGLVDEIGGLRDAITAAVDKAQLKRYKISMFPKQVTFETLLSDGLQGDSEDDEIIKLGSDNKLNSLFTEAEIKSKLKVLNQINPQLARNLQTFIQHLGILSTEGVLLIGPSFNF